MTDTNIDLEKAGLIGNAEEAERRVTSNEEFLERIDQALAGFMFAVHTLTERVGRCELYLSYFLQKDPVLAAKIAAMANVAEIGTEPNEGTEK
jgi:hypothetical protein